MKIEDALIGKKVQIHHGGSVFVIKHVFGRYASLVKVHEDGHEDDIGQCPVSMLDEVAE